MSRSQPNKLSELLANRKIDQEFLYNLEVTDERRYPMPGAVSRNFGDPRINLSSTVARPTNEVILAEHVATIRHKSNGRIFIVYRDTIDALFMESQDLIKCPKWLMDDPRKQNERSIHINEMLRAPKDKYDRDWLERVDDKTYDTLAYFLYMYRTGQ